MAAAVHWPDPGNPCQSARPVLPARLVLAAQVRAQVPRAHAQQQARRHPLAGQQQQGEQRGLYYVLWLLRVQHLVGLVQVCAGCSRRPKQSVRLVHQLPGTETTAPNVLSHSLEGNKWRCWRTTHRLILTEESCGLTKSFSQVGQRDERVHGDAQQRSRQQQRQQPHQEREVHGGRPGQDALPTAAYIWRRLWHCTTCKLPLVSHPGTPRNISLLVFCGLGALGRIEPWSE